MSIRPMLSVVDYGASMLSKSPILPAHTLTLKKAMGPEG